MDILQAAQEIEHLRALYDARQITPETFMQAVNQLQINDAAGYYWHVDGATLRWYRYDGQAWVEQAPPLPPAPPPPQAPQVSWVPQTEPFSAEDYPATIKAVPGEDFPGLSDISPQDGFPAADQAAPVELYPQTLKYVPGENAAAQANYPPQGYAPQAGYYAPPAGATTPAPARGMPRMWLWVGLGVVVLVVLVVAGLIISGVFSPSKGGGTPLFPPPIASATETPRLALSATLAAAATQPATATRAVTASAAVTATRTAMATAAPATATSRPQATAAPAATATRAVAAPTATLAAANFLNAGGPWLISQDQNNLYLIQSNRADAINAEKVVGLTQLSSMIAPRGGHIAFITAPDPAVMKSFKLTIYNLVTQKVEKVIPLSTLKTEPSASASVGDNAFEAMRAVSGPNSLAWSEDGRQLAFVGAQDGPSADIYLYSLDTQKVIRLSDGPSQAYNPSWSPDGKYVVQFGVSSFGTGAGFSMVGAWASPANNSAAIELYKPSSSGEVSLGWANANTFLVYSFNPVCGLYNLRAVNIAPLKVTVLFSGCFNHAAFDRASGTIYLGVTQGQADLCSCGKKVNRGLYQLKLDGTLTPLNSTDISTVAWLPGAAAIWGKGDAAGVAYGQGKAIALPANLPDVEPQVAAGGKAWAWPSGNAAKPGLWMGLPQTGVAQTFEGAISAAAWNPTGTALLFISKDKLYAAPAPANKPQMLLTVPAATELIWVMP